MTKIKSIPKADVEKLIKDTEEMLSKIQQRASDDHRHSHSVSLGMAEATIEHIIEQLKGNHPI